MLLTIVAAMGVFLILYSLFRHITGIGFSEGLERYIMDMILITALVAFVYSRKMARDEKNAAEEAERRAAEDPQEAPSEDEASSQDDASSQHDDDLPHWERKSS